MQESAQAAVTYARMRAPELSIAPTFFERNDIHIHVPAGAIPKDGPSAGITMATALISALTRTPVRKDVAMTGEITLRGKVLPIGGLKEKILAAIRAGITTIIIPEQNRKDLEDVPKQILKKVRIVFAKEIEDVLTVALENYPPPSPPQRTDQPPQGTAPVRKTPTRSRTGVRAGKA